MTLRYLKCHGSVSGTARGQRRECLRYDSWGPELVGALDAAGREDLRGLLMVTGRACQRYETSRPVASLSPPLLKIRMRCETPRLVASLVIRRERR